jgi:putative toxin-antitoxin system antitoxin component (TIGR02293 family)
MMENVNNPYFVIDEAEKGVPLQVFEALVDESGYNKASIAGFIGIDVRTVANYKKANRSFVKTDAEHLIKLKELFGYGKEVFGNQEEFNRWLRKPAHGLGGRIPEQLLNYISGIELVSRELTRIEYGDFS